MNDPSAFRQRVRMAAVQVEGLRPEELSAALAYEVEPFSGIAANEAEIRYAAVEEADPSVRVYDVVVRHRRAQHRGVRDWAHGLKPAIVVGILILALVGADFAWQAGRTARLERVVGRQAQLDAQIGRVRLAARQKREESARIRERRQSLVAGQVAVARLRAAYREVLDEVAVAFGERAVVKSFGGGPRQLAIEAVARSADVAAETMAILSVKAAVCGWSLQPGAIDVRDAGRLTAFECVLSHD